MWTFAATFNSQLSAFEVVATNQTNTVYLQTANAGGYGWAQAGDQQHTRLGLSELVANALVWAKQNNPN